ncbi:MAG TPA: phosphatase PAP2 family protein [Phototrophicaceae bacterium]|nr:phosphatase PAP2 family protein [Phototrophicaceae bacterium]
MPNRYLVTSIILLSVFIVIALIVSPNLNLCCKSVIDADNAIYLYVNHSHYSAIDQFMVYLTLFGRDLFWVLRTILLFVFGDSAGKKTAFVLSIVLLTLVPIGMAAKEIVERPRPLIPETGFLIPADSKFSFPSGHALIVSAAASTVLSLFRDSKKKLSVSLALTIESALVCISRVYVGGHYPLDIIGGLLLGVGISFLFLWKEKELEIIYHGINMWLKSRYEH